MTNSVNYDYVPNQSVYVINTLGPNGEYPYWGFPYNYGCGGPYGYPFYNGGPGIYPNGFTSNTPAIQSGVVLQTRILFTTANPSTPTIMYDVRISGELGTTVFPENMVFPANAGTAGYQTVNYGGTLMIGTVIALPSAAYSALIYVDGAPYTVTIDLSTTSNIAAFIATFNTNAISAVASVALNGGNLTVTSSTTGVTSSIVIIDQTPNPLFGSLPGFVGYDVSVPGVESGLEQAQAYYATLVK